jgi:prepilin-type N-terminal cleavage/methylation domain-containing protein
MTLMRLDERGMTLAEILVAVMIVGIGLVGVLSVIPISSYALTEGKQLSTATFLGAQRLEQARNAPWVTSPANDCPGLGPARPRRCPRAAPAPTARSRSPPGG